MAKDKWVYVCQSCGSSFSKWMGRCTACGQWNSLQEERAKTTQESLSLAHSNGARARSIVEIETDGYQRLSTDMAELDRVLGSGLVRGSVILLAGDPGIGKSTLLMQALSGLAEKGEVCLYVSGEESENQTAARAKRLGISSKNLLIVAENECGAIEKIISDSKASTVVIDSVQTMRSSLMESSAGTISQLREVTARLVDKAKRDEVTMFLVGHVTKDGMIAGPKVLEHLVDTVLHFEGERGQYLRTLRVQKNRFGSATEVGVFEMSSGGIHDLVNPSLFFLQERTKGAPGSVIVSSCEGARALLVEVQALVSPNDTGSGRRVANGVELSRLAMILAVLERQGELELGRSDVFVNVAGGIRIEEPALDLGMALAVASAYRRKPVRDNVAVFGELGLVGEVRRVPKPKERLSEVSAMGFEWVCMPASSLKDDLSEFNLNGLRLLEVKSLSQAFDCLFA